MITTDNKIIDYIGLPQGVDVGHGEDYSVAYIKCNRNKIKKLNENFLKQKTETITCIMYINDDLFLCYNTDKESYNSVLFYTRLNRIKTFRLPEIAGNLTFRLLSIRDSLYRGFFKINCEMVRE